jgi:hypothetical protein
MISPTPDEKRRGWRVGHQGRDRMFYEELHDGTWDRVDIDGEMLTGRAHHVIYFASPATWATYPPWARSRRDEIIARITSEFREPDYEYDGITAAGPAPSVPSSAPSAPRPAPPPRPRATPAPQGKQALLIAVLLLFVIAAGMAWLVVSGLLQGETWLPIRQAYLRRTLSRATEPATFWLVITIYTAVLAGTATLGVMGARAWRKLGA